MQGDVIKWGSLKIKTYVLLQLSLCRAREVAFGEERFEKLCTYIYQTANEHKDKMINKG